jgi:hypothetical protein
MTPNPPHVISQQPNKRAPVHALQPWLYTAANNRKKENKMRWWIKNKVGEAPVTYVLFILADKRRS